MSPRARSGALAAVLVGAGAWMMIPYLERSLLYPRPPVRVPSPPPAPLEEADVEGGAGRLSVWRHTLAGEEAPLVLMLHGNGENLATMAAAGVFADFARLGAGVVALDYPGYGRSAGRPGETANVTATEAVWQQRVMSRRGTGPRVLAGWSLGAAVAIQVAAGQGEEVDGLVLMSAWDRLQELARQHFPAWMVRVVLSERYDSLAVASEVRCPVLVIHGAGDSIVPVEGGRRLFAALPEPKRWFEIPGAGHNDLLARGEVWRTVATFLDELRGDRASPSTRDVASEGPGSRGDGV